MAAPNSDAQNAVVMRGDKTISTAKSREKLSENDRRQSRADIALVRRGECAAGWRYRSIWRYATLHIEAHAAGAKSAQG